MRNIYKKNKIRDIRNITNDLDWTIFGWNDTFNYTSDPIVLLDNNFTIIKANHATEVLTDKQCNEITGSKCWEIFCHEADSPPKKCPLIKMKLSKKHEEKELFFFKRNLWLYASVDPVFYKNDIIGTVHILRNITKFKKKENALQDISGHIIESIENERKKISMELHDGVLQMLASVVFGLKFILFGKSQKDKRLTKQIRKINEILEFSINEIRRISENLRPSLLDKIGFVSAVKNLVGEFQKKKKIHFNLQIQVSDSLNPDMELTLFRIIQEALNNIEKHSSASEVQMILVQADSKIILKIKDNGAGFDFNSQKMNLFHKMKKWGLENIKERVRLVKGIFKINTSPGKGAEIKIKIPLVKDSLKI